MKKTVYFILQIIVGVWLSITFFKQSLRVHPDKFNYQATLYFLGMCLIMIGLIFITKQISHYIITKNKLSKLQPYISNLCFLSLGAVTIGLTFNGMQHLEILNFLVEPYFILFQFGFFVFIISACRLLIQFVMLFAKRYTKN